MLAAIATMRTAASAAPIRMPCQSSKASRAVASRYVYALC